MDKAFDNIVFSDKDHMFRVIFKINGDYVWFGSFRNVHEAVEMSIKTNERIKKKQQICVYGYQILNV